MRNARGFVLFVMEGGSLSVTVDSKPHEGGPEMP